ncbi:unnamed protein product, partial [Trichogramma brassicae]
SSQQQSRFYYAYYVREKNPRRRRLLLSRPDPIGRALHAFGRRKVAMLHDLRLISFFQQGNHFSQDHRNIAFTGRVLRVESDSAMVKLAIATCASAEIAEMLLLAYVRCERVKTFARGMEKQSISQRCLVVPK